MTRIFLAIACFLIASPANALDAASVSIETVEAEGWQLQGVHIALAELAKSPQQLALTIDRLALPEPFNDLNLANIHCAAFTWGNKAMVCTKGLAEIRSQRWQSPAADFSFRVAENRSSFSLTNLYWAGGRFAVEGEEAGHQWRLKIRAHKADVKLMQELTKLSSAEVKDGRISFSIDASGSHEVIHTVDAAVHLKEFSGQSTDARFAAEKLNLTARLAAFRGDNGWQWQHHAEVSSGAVYAEPLYLTMGAQTIALDAQGGWNDKTRQAVIKSASYHHPGAAALKGSAVVRYDDKVAIEKADMTLTSEDLAGLSAAYLKPLFEATALEGVSLAGRMKADFSVAQNALTRLTAGFSDLDVNDESGRLAIQGGDGILNWSSDEAFHKKSELVWQRLQVRALPVGPARLSFLAKAGTIELLEKTKLPFLDGIVAVNELKWQTRPQGEPEVYFEGNVDKVSLEQLSNALNWTPLSGTISGRIPGVDYRDKTLSLGGELNIKVFDGEIKVTNLASSGLFTDFPRLHAELEINNLDLDQLTRRFEFGGITGRLSGYVQQLYMENWKPVSFYAWLGTPDDDDSKHRISQKAVRNIASIGGGGAADILSRSFLRFFETFMYDKIGVGCYLHEGVCQMMGVEAAQQGYYLIKGGGLPRIDVIGYNPRVNWNVLMDRLARILTTDEVRIE
ncbi:C4-dicarboxylate ABC transporter [Methylobacter sp. YRD-M1]|uniref:C4-dicarboxylate ABC transporter n=1 Tax=Methylobacter sp. YRD-M1 TaxID=2911520 RepID=UPI00227A516B|nr:C4-dicarboxylate ABC transporter [Methylobacter sp. YRD-M1]WAK02991.1 C4-dicarboxylate ABC transporter [Methylobacter sp. YRD-M1]